MTDPRVRGVSFVGSTSVGKHVYSVAAAHGKRVQAQTEAKNHGLVLEDASLERAAAGIINSTFGCAGMRCMALPVCVVQESVADEFIGYMKKFAQQRIVGCSYDPKTELGPVVSAEHQKFIKDWINKGVEEGADLVLDGRDLVVPGYEKGFFVGPTIFDNVTEDMTVGRDEIFGPVLAIKRVQDFEEGITLMNNNRFANGSCIFTESGYYAREFARRTPCRHGGHQRRHPGAGQLLPVRRSQGLVLRREPRVRPRRHPLLHRDQVRHVALVHRSRQEAEEGRHLGRYRQPRDPRSPPSVSGRFGGPSRVAAGAPFTTGVACFSAPETVPLCRWLSSAKEEVVGAKKALFVGLAIVLLVMAFAVVACGGDEAGQDRSAHGSR